MFKGIYDIWHIGMIFEIKLLLQSISALQNEMICVYIFLISNYYGTKFTSNLF